MAEVKAYMQEYLGDGVYVEFHDTMQVRLWTPRSNGIHELYLEPEVVARFEAWLMRVVDFVEKKKDRTHGKAETGNG